MTEKSYPMRMIHPNWLKSKVIPITGTNQYGKETVNHYGNSDVHPPVTVMTEAQEEYHRAQGYIADNENAIAPGYSEYPMSLRHPDYKPAVPEVVQCTGRDGTITRPYSPGTPEEFPDKLVTNEAERKTWESRGWRKIGSSDAKAVMDARAAPHMPGREREEYPKIVDGKVIQDPAVAVGFQKYPMFIAGKNGNADRVAQNEAQEREYRLANGETFDEPEPEVIDKAAMKAHLLAQLAALGEDEPETMSRSDKMKAAWAKRKASAA